MNKTSTIFAWLLAATFLSGGGFYLGRQTGSTSASSTVIDSDSRKVLYWHDPMVPGQRFDKPGKSPFMDMQLVPVYADSATGNDKGVDAANEGSVKISLGVQQNLGIRYASVRQTETSGFFDAVGSVQFDERLTTVVQTRVAGYVEQLAVRAPMERVRQGQALATIFAPEWLAPQNEWLALQRSGASADLVAAARDRMQALSIPGDLILRSREAGTAQARYILIAPRSGVVAELGVRQGVAATLGMTLFRIAGLEKVWAVVEIPEAQALKLTRGQKARATLQADSNQSFDGTLDEILPEINTVTRTLKARFEVDNRSGRLVPGMLLRLQVAMPGTSRLVVPSEAVIRTGQRAVVLVRRSDGAIEPRDVSPGAEMGDDMEIVSGLNKGEQVVASGQFLIDSEARLRSVLGNLTMPGSSAAPASAASASPQAAVVHHGTGKVESVSTDGITISHGPVATLQWPAMTMGFAKALPTAFPDIKPGDPVRFEFREGATGYELVSVQRLQPGGRP